MTRSHLARKLAGWIAACLVLAQTSTAVFAQAPGGSPPAVSASAAPGMSATASSASGAAPRAPRPPAPPPVVRPQPAASAAVPASAPVDAGADALEAEDASPQAPDAEVDAVASGGDAADGDVVDARGDVADAAEADAAVAAPPTSAPAPAGSARPSPAPAITPHQPPHPSFWTSFPFVRESDSGDDWSFVDKIFPALPVAGGRGWFAYAVLALLVFGLAALAGRARKRLPIRGLIPRLLAAVNVGGRALAVAFAVAMVLGWLPASLGPALPWMVLAAAAAAGWSARDLLPDVFASVVLLVERKVRPGVWLDGNGYRGEVESLGLRAIRIRGVDGRLATVPNRKLLEEPVVIDPSRHVAVEVVIRPPAGLAPSTVRAAIEDAALLSPWRDLNERPEVRRDADDPRLWRVRVRLIEPRFHQVFESALVDHVEEGLARLTSGARADRVAEPVADGG